MHPTEGERGRARRDGSGDPALGAKMRRAPDFYIVDDDLEVRFASGDVDAVRRKQMPPDLHEAVREIVAAEWCERDRTFGSVNGTAVHVFRVAGGDGPAFCVMPERPRAHDPLANAVRRFRLTDRECDVLRLLLLGLPTGTIAGELNVAETTVAAHVKNIAVKTDSRNRSQIVARVLGFV